jgi:oxygen-dependent protoporphyrinogen oxidase
MTFHVAIVGGGIAGLSVAYHLQQLSTAGVTYTLLDSAPKWGGKIVTDVVDGFVVEGGPDSFITQKPAALRLCRELGLEDHLLGTNDAQRKVYVLIGGRLRPLPDGVMLVIPTKFSPFVLSPLISVPGKMRMGLDLVIPRRHDDGDESLGSFIRRRLGQEALDKIAEPLMSGIHVSDAERQSLAGTFPRFMEMERKHRSLIKGMLAEMAQAKRRPGLRMPVFMTLRNGLRELVEAIVARLAERQSQGDLCLNSRVVRLEIAPDAPPGCPGYRVQMEDGRLLRADAVVLATPSFAAADLLQPLHATLASRLRAIRYVSTATLSLGYRRDEFEHPLNGFGFVVPRREPTRLMACTWTSTKFSHRSPDDYVLMRAFLGGPHREQLVTLDDAAILDLVHEELRCIMGVSAQPAMARLYRWHQANPQYDVGHLERVGEIEALAAALPGLYLTGSAYRGVGIPDCIQQGKNTAQAILTAVAQQTNCEVL